jgi:hypothetical protein
VHRFKEKSQLEWETMRTIQNNLQKFRQGHVKLCQLVHVLLW